MYLDTDEVFLKQSALDKFLYRKDKGTPKGPEVIKEESHYQSFLNI